MTMAEAVTQARQTLGAAASEDEIATQAATCYIQAASPEEQERLFFAAAQKEIFAVFLEHAPELTEEQMRSLEMTEAQAARMAARRQRDV